MDSSFPTVPSSSSSSSATNLPVRTEDDIRRPPNPYILFLTTSKKYFKNNGILTSDEKILVSWIASFWRQTPKNGLIRNHFKSQEEYLKGKHKEVFPHYKFTPKTKEEKRRIKYNKKHNSAAAPPAVDISHLIDRWESILDNNTVVPNDNAISDWFEAALSQAREWDAVTASTPAPAEPVEASSGGVTEYVFHITTPSDYEDDEARSTATASLYEGAPQEYLEYHFEITIPADYEEEGEKEVGKEKGVLLNDIGEGERPESASEYVHEPSIEHDEGEMNRWSQEINIPLLASAELPEGYHISAAHEQGIVNSNNFNFGTWNPDAAVLEPYDLHYYQPYNGWLDPAPALSYEDLYNDYTRNRDYDLHFARASL